MSEKKDYQISEKAARELRSYDYLLRELPYMHSQRARKKINRIVELLEVAVRFGYEDFAKVYAIILARALRVVKDV